MLSPRGLLPSLVLLVIVMDPMLSGGAQAQVIQITPYNMQLVAGTGFAGWCVCVCGSQYMLYEQVRGFQGGVCVGK